MIGPPRPVVLEPILKAKVWGGRRLERFGKALPMGELIGESWELSDLQSTSASGGGGGAAHSRVASGPLTGRSIDELGRTWGDAMLGRPGAGGFPLLVKYLDAREHLSVQVHPSPAYAAAHPGAHLKTECWFVLDAEPGSVILKGIRPGVTREEFRGHIERGTVPEALVAAPAVVGEMHNLPSGTCHALGGGVLVAEIQTPSDTTFRVYDWAGEYGRAGRELHVGEALANIEFGPAPGATRLEPGHTRGELVRTPFYIVEQVELGAGASEPIRGSGASVVMVVGGNACVASPAGDTHVRCGDTVLVPAACAAEASISATTTARALIAHVV